MEAKTLQLKRDVGEQNNGRRERRRNALVFFATLIATLVLGVPPDFDWLISWFLARRHSGSAGVQNVDARINGRLELTAACSSDSSGRLKC